MEPARFIDREVYIDTETDWGQIDYVLVGSDDNLIGILSLSDVFGRLNDFAEAFVILYEIEHEIRELIRDVADQPRGSVLCTTGPLICAARADCRPASCRATETFLLQLLQTSLRSWAELLRTSRPACFLLAVRLLRGVTAIGHRIDSCGRGCTLYVTVT
jgi:hypothetical protein